jgi:hypothetical protein
MSNKAHGGEIIPPTVSIGSGLLLGAVSKAKQVGPANLFKEHAGAPFL